MFIIKLLPQNVSGIITPIIRRIRPCPTARGVLHWVCRLWLAVVLWSCVVSSVHCVEITVRLTFTQCTLLTTQLHKTTANHSLHTQCRRPHAEGHGLILLMMGIMMPETY